MGLKLELEEAILGDVDARHRDVESAFSKIVSEVRPFEGNETKANVEVPGELIGVGDVVADQFPAGIPVTERDDSGVETNTDFAFLLNACKDALE